MKFSAVAEQGFPAIDARMSVVRAALSRPCAHAVQHRHDPMSASHASASIPRARIDVALMHASMLRPIAATSRIGCAARDLRVLHACSWSSQSHRHRAVPIEGERDVSAASIDMLRTSICTRRSHRSHAYGRVECEKFARVVASTHRFFSTRIAQLARRRARRCRMRTSRVRAFTMHA